LQSVVHVVAVVDIEAAAAVDAPEMAFWYCYSVTGNDAVFANVVAGATSCLFVTVVAADCPSPCFHIICLIVE
jgi:hypothetical protein